MERDRAGRRRLKHNGDTSFTFLTTEKDLHSLASASVPALTLLQVFEGRLVNHPTCIDKPFPQCERHVNSAVCILE